MGRRPTRSLFAITAEEAGRKRYSAFIVPRGTAGLTTEAMPGFHALRPSEHCLLTLDGCVVPAEAMLGEAGTAYERMASAVPRRGGCGREFRHARGAALCGGAVFRCGRLAETEELGAVVALTAVFAAGAEAVVARWMRGGSGPAMRRWWGCGCWR